MLSRVTKILLFLALIFYAFHFLFFFVYETTDSFFYWEFAEFLRTGKYFVGHPFYWSSPSTIEAPLYSVFLYLVALLPRSDVLLHFIQIVLLFLSALFINKILKNITTRSFAFLVSVLFLFIPSHIFFVNTMMAELFSIFLVSLFIFMSFRILETGKESDVNVLVLLSAVSVLLRFNFIVLYFFALLLFIYNRKFKIKNFIPVILSLFILVSWVIINFRLTGAFGLSDSQGKHLYNRIVAGDRLLPPPENKNLKELERLVNNRADLFSPSYDIEPYIKSELGNSLKRENDLLGNVAIAALRAHPAEFAVRLIKDLFIIHGNGFPFSIWLHWDDPARYTKCRSLGTTEFCKPIIDSNLGKTVWEILLSGSEYYYLNFPAVINLAIFVPSIIFALINKNKFMRFTVLLYFASVLSALLAEIPVQRYQYPLYPLKIILVTYFFSALIIKKKN